MALPDRSPFRRTYGQYLHELCRRLDQEILEAFRPEYSDDSQNEPEDSSLL